MLPTVTVILIHWNQPRACARTAQTFAGLPEVAEVVIVDNGSTDQNRACLDTLLEDFLDAPLPGECARISIIDVGFNSGFGPAANRGWEYWLRDGSAGEWSVVAPHDARPADDTIARMLDAARQVPTAGLLSADVGDGFRPLVDHVFGPILVPALGRVGFEPADYPHGTMMMASRSCLSTIGLFDERFFAYCEEADLGLRAKKAGFAVGLVRGAMVENPMVSTPAPSVEYLMERNTILLMSQHFGRRKTALRFALMVWQLVAGTVSRKRRTPYWSSRARLAAIVDVLRQRWGAPAVDGLMSARDGHTVQSSRSALGD